MFPLFKQKDRKAQKTSKEVLEQLEVLGQKIEGITRELTKLKQEGKKAMSKVGIVRFNPFQEIGGDQSFSIALLDGNNDGVIVTGYYAREMNRVYAKPVNRGVSEYSLSDEEKEAIRRAMNPE
ncbi:MAG: DUF4446 family protein [Patescibacteria group bacterium]